MAVLIIENSSNDKIICSVGTEKYEVDEGERFTVNGINKGKLKLLVHRARIPIKNGNEELPTDIKERFEKEDESIHAQLDTEFTVEIISSKSVINISQSFSSVNRLMTDAIFKGYQLELTGAKQLSKKSFFASKKIKRQFILTQLKNAFLPVGLIGIILTLTGVGCIRANLKGKAVNLGGTSFSMPLSIVLTVIAAACTLYFVASVIKIILTAKKYNE